MAFEFSRLHTLLAALWSVTFVVVGSANAAEAADSDTTRPYLILISIDGFRHDYQERFPTPALDRIARRGVRAEAMQPVWPTLTFPNHYSIATGLYPAAHGIVANEFADEQRQHWYRYKDRDTVQDGRWYRGVPLWVAAERAGMHSAAFYFVGTEAPVAGISLSHWRTFDASVPGETRIRQALDWLKLPVGERPQVIALYFEQVDEASHRYGPGSAESIAAIARVDGWIGELLDGIEKSGLREQLHIVVVSDHGQGEYRRDVEPLVLSEFLNLEGITVVESGAFAMLYLDEENPARTLQIRDAVNARWQNGHAWLPDEAPDFWHVSNSRRLGDVLLQADAGFAVLSSRELNKKMTPGDHGWSPNMRDMHGIFLAAGPRLPAGRRINTIRVTDVYPLLLELIGLQDTREQPPASPLCDLLEAFAACNRQ